MEYKNRIYMTVLVNVQSDTNTIEGSVKNILPLTKDKEYEHLSDSGYIDHIKYMAYFFMQNKICDFNKYHQESS